MLLRVGALGATLVLATAVLGLEAYGRLVTALAVGGMLSPLAGLGLHMRIMTGWRAAAGRHRAWLGGLMGEWLIASSLLAVLGCLGFGLWTGFETDITAPFAATAMVLALEILAASGIEWMARASLMRGGTAHYARTLAIFPVARLAVLLPFVLREEISFAAFAQAWCVATVLAILLAIRASGAGRPTLPRPGTWWRAVRTGAPFMAGATAYRLQAEFNKPVIAASGYALAGALGLAQRVLDVMTLPLLAVQTSLSQRLFTDQPALKPILLRAFGAVLGATSIGIALALGAPLAGRWLGPEFTAVISALVQLSALPVLQVLRQTSTLLLIWQDESRWLPLGELPACAVAVIATAVWVPRLGIEGAVWGLYAGEGCQFAIQAALLVKLMQQRHRAAREAQRKM